MKELLGLRGVQGLTLQQTPSCALAELPRPVVAGSTALPACVHAFEHPHASSLHVRTDAGSAAPLHACTRLSTLHAASFLQVWKDVDGVLSSDPRIVTSAQPVNELTYEEATELAFFGAQVCVCCGLCVALTVAGACAEIHPAAVHGIRYSTHGLITPTRHRTLSIGQGMVAWRCVCSTVPLCWL